MSGMKLGSFVTGAVISVFVTALMILELWQLGHDDELLIASTEYTDSPLEFGWVAFGLIALAVDHRSDAQRGIYKASEGETGDDEDHGDHADSDLNQPHTPGQKLTWTEILAKITDLESRLNEVSKETSTNAPKSQD